MKHHPLRAVLALAMSLSLLLCSAVPAFAAAKKDGDTRFESVSFVVTDDKATNIGIMNDYIEKAAANDVDLILFPELSSCGLPESISMNTVDEENHKFFEENAESVPDGPTVQNFIEKAKEYHMYICWSMLERDAVGSIYNTAVLVGPEGFIGKYHKVHLAGTEAYMETAGTEYGEVYDTELGKIGMVICFDKTFPDTVRALKLKGAEIVLAPSAWPGLHQKLGDLDVSMQLYRYSGKSRNVENGVVFIETNWACAEEDGMNAEAGHARISDAQGKTLAENGWTGGAVTADINVQKSIEEYYKSLGMTEEEHLKSLQEKQDKSTSQTQTLGLLETNLKFYGNAILNTLFDTPDALFYLTQAG